MRRFAARERASVSLLIAVFSSAENAIMHKLVISGM